MNHYTERQAMREEIEETQSEVLNNRLRCIMLLDKIENLMMRVERVEEEK